MEAAGWRYKGFGLLAVLRERRRPASSAPSPAHFTSVSISVARSTSCCALSDLTHIKVSEFPTADTSYGPPLQGDCRKLLSSSKNSGKCCVTIDVKERDRDSKVSALSVQPSPQRTYPLGGQILPRHAGARSRAGEGVDIPLTSCLVERERERERDTVKFRHIALSSFPLKMGCVNAAGAKEGFLERGRRLPIERSVQGHPQGSSEQTASVRLTFRPAGFASKACGRICDV